MQNTKCQSKLVIYVHELFKEFGHSKAMIETLNHLRGIEIESIKVVAFRSGHLPDLFSRLKDTHLEHVKVPLFGLRPILLRTIFYHLYTFFYSLFKVSSDEIEISVGTASLRADIVNIQFVQKHWAPMFFKFLRPSGIYYYYKKFQFLYNSLCENLMFRGDKHLMALSRYCQEYCQKSFNIPDDHVHLSYSGINLEEFSAPLEKQKAYQQLIIDYPEIEKIELEKPIYLFVGAYERKGLQYILNKLPDHSQLLVIGEPQGKTNIHFPERIKVIRISFTRKLPLFYSLADCFVFPSIYEPFGLVIIEAAAMGLRLCITKKFVGASELLIHLPGVDSFEDPEKLEIPLIKILSLEEKIDLREKRLIHLKEYNWQKTADCYSKVIKLCLNRS